jgi:SMI1 / KNR4 family (SUKH-1)
MKELLISISVSAIAHNPDAFTEQEKKEQWIGREPATAGAIELTEKRLKVELPADVIEFYQITNGTSEILSQTFGEFLTIDQINWLTNVDQEVLENYAGMGEDYLVDLKNSILIAGLNHVHQILLIQPYGKFEKWRYWEFATYIPGANEFNNIEMYLDRVNVFLLDQIKWKAESEDNAVVLIDG